MLNDLYHSLDPVAFSIGAFTVRWYALAYLAGFLCAGIVLYKTQKRWGLDITKDEVISIVVAIAWGIIIGARLFYVIFYGQGWAYYLSNPIAIIATWDGGMSFHGGLVGAVVGGALACRAMHISIPTVCDLGVIGAPLGLFFGRCANFVNGELWGRKVRHHNGYKATGCTSAHAVVRILQNNGLFWRHAQAARCLQKKHLAQAWHAQPQGLRAPP